MNKLQMAQEYALKMLENLNPMQIDKPTRDGLAYECFELAEAMLAENEKRVVKLPDVFFDAKQNEEWQIKCDELQGRIDEAMDYIAESGGVNLTSEMALNHILKGNKDEN